MTISERSTLAVPHPICGKPYEVITHQLHDGGISYLVLFEDRDPVVCVGRLIQAPMRYEFADGEFEAIVAWQAANYSKADIDAAYKSLRHL